MNKTYRANEADTSCADIRILLAVLLKFAIKQIIAIMTHILELLQQVIAPDGVVMAITPLIGAGVSLASSIGNAIFGGLSANKQKKEQLRAIRKQQQENRNWYNRRYNEDATQRADVQRMLSRTNEAIKARNRAAAGKQKVVGGTDASLASTQQANARAVGDALSEVAAKAEARKDNIEAQYRERKADLDAQEDAVRANAAAAQRANVAQAATDAVKTGASMAESAFENSGAGKQKDGKQAGGKQTSIMKTSWASIFDSPDLERTAY